jgi:hypothetical protein
MAASNSLPRQHASPHLQLTQPSYGSFGLGSQEYLTNSGSQGARYQNPPPPAPLPARPAQALLAPGPEAPLYLLDELAKHANAVGELRDTVAKLDATVSRLEQRVGDHRADIGDIKEAVQGVHTFQGELMHTLSSQINSLQVCTRLPSPSAFTCTASSPLGLAFTSVVYLDCHRAAWLLSAG